MAAVVEDVRTDTSKTGMLATAEIIEIVVAKIKEHALPFVVVDPVMVAKSGDRLLREDALLAIRKLLPLADVLTPNLPEAEDLLGHAVRTNKEMREAARELQSLGPRNVVIKGGHGEGESALDILLD